MCAEYYSGERIRSRGMPFNFIIGGRGIGKTYDFITHFIKNDVFHMYLRRCQKEIDLTVNKHINPYAVPSRDLKAHYEIAPQKDIAQILDTTDNKAPKLKGFGVALSTFSNIRGGDFSRVTDILWDEFIAEKSKRKTIKNEADAFFNLYESVNRNREFNGESPVRVYFLSNAVSISAEILAELGLITVLEQMIKDGQKFYTDQKRGICIELAFLTGYADEKAKSALYQLTHGTRFYDHALDNKFAYDSWYNIVRRNIVEYYPVCSVCNIYIYRHKSSGKLYATFIKSDCPKYTEDQIALFKRNHYFEIREKMIAGKMEYENMTIKTRMEEILPI